MATLALAVLGLVAGSFVGAWLHRLRTGASVAVGRSACPLCSHQLAWYDLVPLVSWLVLRGRCRYCHQRISWQYPSLELLMALLFVLTPLASGWAAAGVYLAAAVLLAAAAVFDARWMELPDTFSWMLAGLALFRLAALGWGGSDWGVLVVNSLVGLAVGAGFFGLQYLASRGKWIGTGDIFLGASLGLLLGWPATALALVLAYVAGALVAVPLLAGKSRGWSSAVAFGPFIALGGLAALRFGPGLMQWLGWV